MIRATLLASALTAGITMSTAALADSPREFLEKAVEGDNSEIMLGRLAAEQAQSPAVRDFCNTLVNDHRQAREEIRQLGGQFGIGANRDVAPEAREERDKLMELRGREFDREFVRYMVDDHRKDVREFREESQEHHGPVSALAQRQLPTLREHLRMALALDRSDGRSSEGMADTNRGNDQYRGQDRDQGDRQYDSRDNNQYPSDSRDNNQYPRDQNRPSQYGGDR
jgi:putative membrane protein